MHSCDHLSREPSDRLIRLGVGFALISKRTLLKDIGARCRDCRLFSDRYRRLYVCLDCEFVGCWDLSGGHLFDHLNQAGHSYFVDQRKLSGFCAQCVSVVDFRLERLVDYVGLAFKDFVWTKNCHLEIVNSIGIRGLYNLGNTCFMNSILQVILHNSTMDKYFMTESHPFQDCKYPNCLACELDKLFIQQHLEAGDQAPFSPSGFLHCLWLSSQTLQGYFQQDAHEFFMTLLDILHIQLGGSPDPCTCVIHQTWYGLLESTVTCSECRNVCVASDPFVDISLDMAQNNTSISLTDCLAQFSSPETLDSYVCEQCGLAGNGTKQFRISRLPPSLCLCLKRFKTFRGVSKVDTRVVFPFVLEMYPFVTLSNHQCTAYTLFGVVIHTGGLDSGHYVAYIRQAGLWFRLDDARISVASEQEVSVCNPYMLFYGARDEWLQIKG